MKVKVAQSRPTIVTPSTIRSMEFPGQNTGEGSLSLLQGIFPIQESNPDLLHCRQILYQLSHKGTPRIVEWVTYPFSSGSSWPRNWTEVSCITDGFFKWISISSVFPMNTQGWFTLGVIGLISLLSKGFSRVLYNRSLFLIVLEAGNQTSVCQHECLQLQTAIFSLCPYMAEGQRSSLRSLL